MSDERRGGRFRRTSIRPAQRHPELEDRSAEGRARAAADLRNLQDVGVGDVETAERRQSRGGVGNMFGHQRTRRPPTIAGHEGVLATHAARVGGKYEE